MSGEEDMARGNPDSANPGEDSAELPARPVCLHCLRPCDPLQFYCRHCDSSDVINPLASYMPFVRIRFECGFFGRAWRRLWYDQQASFTLRAACLLVVTLWAPIMLFVGVPLFILDKVPQPRMRIATVILFVVAAVVILMVLIRLSLFGGAISPVPIR